MFALVNSSAVSSLLGKRNMEETPNPLEPEKKKKNQGKKNIEKDVINGALLDYISSYIDKDKTKRRVCDLSDKEIKKLAQEQPEIKNWITEIEQTSIPSNWKVDLEHCKVKKAFMVAIHTLNITLADDIIPLFENSAYVEIEKLLSNYESGSIDFGSFESKINKHINISNSDECLWKQAISSFRRQTTGKATEQELTRNMFAPLFNFTSNLERCEGNA